MVTFHCDNTAAVSVINSGYSRVPNIILCLFFIRAHFQLEAWAVHTPGVENGRADAISWNNMCCFRLQVPVARDCRVPIPPAPIALLAEQQPDWTSWLRLSCLGAIFSWPSSLHPAELPDRYQMVYRVLSGPTNCYPIPNIQTNPVTPCCLASHPALVQQYSKKLFGSCPSHPNYVGFGRPTYGFNGPTGVGD